MKWLNNLKKNWSELNFPMKCCTVLTSPIWLPGLLYACVLAALLVGLFAGFSLFDED